MRRIERKMSEEATLKLLSSGEWGVLSLTDGTEAYGVPINYVFDEKSRVIYFHAAKVGKKIDFCKKGLKASFTVVGTVRIVAERYTTHYESVIAEGSVNLVDDEEEKRTALIKLCEKFSPNETNRLEKSIDFGIASRY